MPDPGKMCVGWRTFWSETSDYSTVSAQRFFTWENYWYILGRRWARARGNSYPVRCFLICQDFSLTSDLLPASAPPLPPTLNSARTIRSSQFSANELLSFSTPGEGEARVAGTEGKKPRLSQFWGGEGKPREERWGKGLGYFGREGFSCLLREGSTV